MFVYVFFFEVEKKQQQQQQHSVINFNKFFHLQLIIKQHIHTIII